MRTYHESDIRRRTLVVSFLLAAWFAVLLLRLFQLQVIDHAGFEARASRQSRAKVTVQARRGTIYDRNGKVLASSLPVFTVKLSPVEKEKPAQETEKVKRLQAVLGLSEKEVADILKSLRDNDSFTFVKKKVSPEVAARVRDLKLPGIGFDEENKRVYPNGPLAAHVIGGVNADGSKQAGVESRYNPVLKGEDGQEIVFKDNKKREYQSQVTKPPVSGQDIFLTIDATIQHIADRALARAIDDHSATSGTIIICEPATGEILAMANYPTYDVNDYTESKGAWLNRAIGSSYEPGSTFKIVAAAAALEKGVVHYSDEYDCSAGFIKVGPLTIRDHEQMGILPFPKVLIESSNVGTVKFASRLAATELYEMIRRFGFGSRTGIDLPAEEPGHVRPVAEWNKVVSQPHIAIGYEINVTPLQMLRAMNVFATRGRLVRPRIVRRSPAVPAAPVQGPPPQEKIIGEDLAEGLRAQVFEKVVEEGTAKLGRMEEFWAAGKTGTAQRYDPTLKAYTTKSHTASFVGFVPSRRPAISMIVVLDDPKEGFYYGGQVCAPIFRDVARQVLRYLEVGPDRPVTAGVITAELQRKERP
ncbi:MAG: penicillin-binding protein 2 [Candidatus Aminicenantales bacterium]|jgi:cell division protein FtsI (penicillin-binding protein 3)